MLFSGFSRALQALPSRCAVCARWPARPVCAACLARFARVVARCGRCALPVPEGVAECGRCIAAPPPLDACHAAVAWAFPWSGFMTLYKFHGQAGAAGTLARLLAAVPGVPDAVAQAGHVLAMPLSRERLAERGFNQALEIARRLAPGRAEAALLLRIRHTPPQAALDLAARLANLEGAFAVEPARAHLLRGARVVLVDDVMTSGATFHAAARVLRAAGASHVTALAVARTE